jgi:hypothetical protein
VKVFFYGLFMDESLLATKGIRPSQVSIGCVEGYALRIGQRATLVRCPDSRAYGVLMEIAAEEAELLYADKSVADYLPETVTAELMDGTRVQATCYNLPDDKVTGTNGRYAESLLDLATALKFPEPYLEQIRLARY